MKTYPLYIAGLGKYLPQRRVHNAELEGQLGLRAGWIAKRTGVLERRYVTHESSVSMATEAAKIAIKMANLELKDIDCMIGASAAPQQALPCTAALVQRALGAPDGGSLCFDLNATCLSFLLALQQAALLLEMGPYHNILIFSSEIVSVSLNPREPESYTLFGDGAAAVVVSKGTGINRTARLEGAAFQTFSSGADFTRVLGGGTLHHPNDPKTTFDMNVFEMDGPAIFKQATRLMNPMLERLFAQIGWKREDIDAVIPHQASKHAMEQLTRRLGFLESQVFVNLEQRGNCVAASIPLALVEAVEAGRLERGGRALLIGTAAGLTLGAVAITF